MKRKAAGGDILMYSRGRLASICAVVALLLCAIIARLYYLHVVRAPESVAETSRARERVEILPSRRGSITDSKSNILAISSPVITIGVDPKTFKFQIGRDNGLTNRQIAAATVSQMSAYKPSEQTRQKLREISELLNVPYERLCKLCTSEGSWHKIAVVEDEDVYQQIRKLNVKGIYGNRKYVRKYPSGPLMSHIVGFVNREFQPVMGIERQFQYYLNGQDGWIETERDGRRAEQAQFRKRKVDPADGNNIELSIDLVIQEIVQRQMEKIAAAFHPEKAAIIVSDPATGYILAMSSYPNFDPNNYTKFKNENFLNFVISGQYEPGSTFKIIPVAGALNEGIIGPDDAFDCTATSMMYNGRQVRLPKDDHPLGPRATTRQIIQKSSNRGSAIIGGRLGAARLISYAKAFGIGEKTDIGLSGEISGTLLPLDRWDGLTISRMPIGHAVAVTPLQIHCAMSVIANQGIYMKPQLVKRVYDNKGQTVINYSPRAMRRVISPKVAALMSEMLSTVTISGGTARRAAIKGFEVAGKTGTSQKFIKAKDLPPLPDGTPRKRGEYSNKKHVGSFTGFFPTKAPRLVITVVVDTPKLKGVGYGGIVAAPAFREIGEQLAVYLGIQSDEEFEKKIAWKAKRND